MHTRMEVKLRLKYNSGETTNPVCVSAYALPNDEVQWLHTQFVRSAD